MPEKLKGACPSCGNESEFKFCGKQEVPPEIRQAFGYAALWLYHCLTCRTTISHRSIQQ